MAAKASACQIGADNLERPLDWQAAGYDMPPLEWHQNLKEAWEGMEISSSNGGDCDEPLREAPVVLDCQNDC